MSVETMKEIAQRLVTFCREAAEEECLNQLYAEDAVSVEAMPMPGQETGEILGLDGIRAKHAQWYEMMEMHSSTADGPYYHGDSKFAVIFSMDATDRGSGERMSMQEVGVYTVANDKIVREEFYYQF